MAAAVRRRGHEIHHTETKGRGRRSDGVDEGVNVGSPPGGEGPAGGGGEEGLGGRRADLRPPRVGLRQDVGPVRGEAELLLLAHRAHRRERRACEIKRRGRLVALGGGGATVADLLQNLKALGLKPHQLVNVFTNLKKHGFLQADLEVR